MKAAVYAGERGRLEIREVPTPEPAAGEVLVRVVACGVCHTDLHYIDHGVPTAKKPPIILGHEAVGVVAAGAGDLPVGQPVLIPAVLTCGQCALCKSGRSNICASMRMLGNHIDGAFCEFVRIGAKDVFRLPEEVPLKEACVIADAVSTAYHAAVHRGQVRQGTTVAVFGCGGVGINVVQVCAMLGARVAAVDLDESKLSLARRFGAAAVVPARAGDEVVKRVKAAFEGPVDVAFECIGNPETIRQAHDCVRRGGRLCIVGYSEQPASLQVGRVMFYEQDVVGSLGCPTEVFPEVIELVRQKKLTVSGLVSSWFPLEGINDALETLRKGKGLRTAVLPGGSA